MPQLVLKVADRRVKADYARACQILGNTLSAPLHRAVLTTIKRAQLEFPHAFNLLNDDDEIVIEAIEESLHSFGELRAYTRFDGRKLRRVLASLVLRGRLVEAMKPRAKGARGPVQKYYYLPSATIRPTS